ncbi:MAG TPA: hypothetical protein EYO58_01895 [Flavobacteriales bacterium]|nr:hypothetical protein [Flavobacteriales bacterium]
MSSWSSVIADDGVWQTSLGLDLRNLAYREFADNGELLDREDGLLSGVVLGVTYASSKWEVSSHLSVDIGEVNYRGETNLGDKHRTDTDERFIELGVMVRRSTLASQMKFHPYAGLSYQRWSRKIKSTPSVLGLNEEYAWWTGFVGAQYLVSKQPMGSLLIDGRVFYTVSPQVRVEFLDAHDPVTLALDAKPGIRIALPYVRKFSHHSILFEPYIERYEFGRSQTQALTIGGNPSGTVFEPNSETIDAGLRVIYTFE